MRTAIKIAVRTIVIMGTFALTCLIVTFLVTSHSDSIRASETQPFELYHASDVGISILTTANFNSTIFNVKGDNGQLSENLIWFIQVGFA